MKIRNDGKEFIITYDAKDFLIPTGDMEIADEGFATYVVNKCRKWDMDVKKIGVSDESEVKSIKKIVEVEDGSDPIKKVKEEKTTKKKK